MNVNFLCLNASAKLKDIFKPMLPEYESFTGQIIRYLANE